MSRTSQCWGWYSNDGELHHNGGYTHWPGQQGWRTGDVLELTLDCDAGTLEAVKSGVKLGTLATNLQGKSLRWSCELFNADDAIRLEQRLSRLEHEPEPE